jgi:hypothetical protein
MSALVVVFLLFDTVRAGSPAFEAYVFPILLGLLVWGGVWLRDERLRALFPLRRPD